MKSHIRTFIDDNFALFATCLLGALVCLAGANFFNIIASANQERAFQYRTVDRWNKLQKDNPNLRVPKIVEPIDKARLTDAEMERKQ